jgi:hypothetical protein
VIVKRVLIERRSAFSSRVDRRTEPCAQEPKHT